MWILHSFVINRTSLISSPILNLILLTSNLASTTDLTSPPSGDKTNFPTWRSSPLDGRRMTNMLMVTTTMGMLDWIHSNTSDFRPAVPLDTVLVVGSSGFQHGFVTSTTASNDTDNSSVVGRVQFFDARWKLDSGPASVWVVGDDSDVTTTGLGKFATVTSLFLHRAADGTFRHLADWQNVTDSQLSFLTSMDELTGANTFRSDHGLVAFPVFVWVVELDLGEGRTSAWVVDDVFDETLDEPVTFGVVEGSELGGAFPFGGDGCED